MAVYTLKVDIPEDKLPELMSEVNKLGHVIRLSDQPLSSSKLNARNEEITALYLEDPRTNSCGELGRRYNISRERVCQILRRSNAIGYAQTRKEAARSAYKSAAEKVKTETNEAVEAKMQEALELVRGGMSLRQAAQAVGLGAHSHLANTLGRKAHLAGIDIQHGRHRDFSKRLARIRELSAQGFTIPELVAKMRREDDPHVYSAWVYKHVPEARVQPRCVKNLETNNDSHRNR